MNTTVYRRKENPEIDQEFKGAPFYGKVKIGNRHIFWKKGFRWLMIEMEKVQRAYRRIEAVDSKMCCGNVNFDIQKLVLILSDNTSLELFIGEGMPKEAEALYENLKSEYPQIHYGKYTSDINTDFTENRV